MTEKPCRKIKKYSNRRLYDTTTSRYITLDDIHCLVMEQEPFQVLDANSGDDLTCHILMQVILDQESGKQPLFSADVLSNFIRFHGDSTRDIFRDFLESHMSLFTQQQKFIHERWQGSLLEPMKIMQQVAQRNFESWQQLQQNITGRRDDKSRKN